MFVAIGDSVTHAPSEIPALKILGGKSETSGGNAISIAAGMGEWLRIPSYQWELGLISGRYLQFRILK